MQPKGVSAFLAYKARRTAGSPLWRSWAMPGARSWPFFFLPGKGLKKSRLQTRPGAPVRPFARGLFKAPPGTHQPFALDLPSPASRKKLEPAATFLNSPVTKRKKRKKKTPEDDAAFRDSPPLHFAVTRAPNSRRCRLHVCCVSRSLNVTYRFSLTKSRESSTWRVPLGPRKGALRRISQRVHGWFMVLLFFKASGSQTPDRLWSVREKNGIKAVILVGITLST